MKKFTTINSPIVSSSAERDKKAEKRRIIPWQSSGGRLYRHVGLNLYDQPLSRGRISSAIGAFSFLPCDSVLETSAATAAELLVVDVSLAVHAAL